MTIGIKIGKRGRKWKVGRKNEENKGLKDSRRRRNGKKGREDKEWSINICTEN